MPFDVTTRFDPLHSADTLALAYPEPAPGMPALMVNSAASHLDALVAMVGTTKAVAHSAPAPMAAVPRRIEGSFMAVTVPTDPQRQVSAE